MKNDNSVQHFAVNADDVDRARRFYESVFGWKAEAYGPPDFFRFRTKGVEGAVQKRREIVPGKVMNGFECSIGVADVDAIAAKVKKAGGKIVMEKAVIPGVGSLIFFEDTEGNVAGAMQYENG